MPAAADGLERLTLAADQQNLFALIQNLIAIIGFDHYEMRVAVNVGDAGAGTRAGAGNPGLDGGEAADQRIDCDSAGLVLPLEPRRSAPSARWLRQRVCSA